MKCFCKAVAKRANVILKCLSRKLSRKYREKTLTTYIVLVKPSNNTVACYLAYVFEKMQKNFQEHREVLFRFQVSQSCTMLGELTNEFHLIHLKVGYKLIQIYMLQEFAWREVL